MAREDRPSETARPHSDGLLVAAVRADPPDGAALQALVDRHWRRLFGRCRLLTQNADLAADLAQETWYRVIRGRRALDPRQSLAGYLATIAMNLWRDWNRVSRRDGGMSVSHDWSLDAAMPNAGGEPRRLADALPDPRSLEAEKHAQLRMDVDAALAWLTPQLRAIVISRFVDGESAAEIGRRYSRTEETVTGWLR